VVPDGRADPTAFYVEGIVEREALSIAECICLDEEGESLWNGPSGARLRTACSRSYRVIMGFLAHPHAMRDVGSVILNVIVENLALDSEARCFGSVLGMTIPGISFSEQVLYETKSIHWRVVVRGPFSVDPDAVIRRAGAGYIVGSV
jgi:hypothetical protein